MSGIERAVYVAIIAILGVAVWSMKQGNGELAGQAEAAPVAAAGGQP